MRRIFVLLCALLMLGGLAVPALAAPPSSSITINEPAPYLDGQTVTFTVTLAHKPKTEPVLIFTCWRDQVMTTEQRGTVVDSYTISGDPAYCVVNVYEIVRGDYMVQAVLMFDVGATALTSAKAAPAAAAGSISINEPGPYALGDTLTFTTTIPKLAGWQYPLISVECFQDVDGDGIIEHGWPWDDVVFTWLDKPDASFTLGGSSSIWINRGGGPAECDANLDAYGWKGGQQYVTVLASVPFAAA